MFQLYSDCDQFEPEYFLEIGEKWYSDTASFSLGGQLVFKLPQDDAYRLEVVKKKGEVRVRTVFKNKKKYPNSNYKQICPLTSSQLFQETGVVINKLTLLIVQGIVS
jgi:hypothetical protein